MEGQKEHDKDCVQANLNPNVEVNLDNDVHINGHTTLEKNVWCDPNKAYSLGNAKAQIMLKAQSMAHMHLQAQAHQKAQ